jgi:hypothetical protein
MHTKLGLKTLAICGLVLGLTAVATSIAQAEVGAHLWTVNAAGQLVDLSVALNGKKDPNVSITLSSTIIKIGVVVSCTEIALLGAKSEENGTIGKGSKYKLSGCSTKLNGTLSPECEPINEGKEKGVILSKAAHSLVRLDVLADMTKHDVFETTPDAGNVLMTIEMGASCPIGTKVNLLGWFQVKDCQGEFLVHKVEHLVQVLLEQLFMISETAEHATTLGGSWMLFLSGAHLGLKWSIEPK